MKIEKLLREMKDRDESSVMPQDSDTSMSGEGDSFKVLINSDTSFKGRITKPTVISFKYKELAEALSEASGMSVNRMRAKAMFEVFRRMMGL